MEKADLDTLAAAHDELSTAIAELDKRNTQLFGPEGHPDTADEMVMLKDAAGKLASVLLSLAPPGELAEPAAEEPAPVDEAPVEPAPEAPAEEPKIEEPAPVEPVVEEPKGEIA